ncbi:hypothetical protein BH23BAC4_BH23BAC4_06070 [soil metagenome]
MSLIPEWAPNVHPLVVHFPIALVVVGFLVDMVAVALRNRTVRFVAAGLYGGAAVGAIAAYFTGLRALETVALPPEAFAVANAHADAGWLAMWILGIYAVIRIGVAWWDRANRLVIHLPLALLGIGCIVAVWMAAGRGAELVFKHGVGVAAVQVEDPLAGTISADSLMIAEDGSWRWQAAAGQAAPPEFDLRGLTTEPSDDGLVLRPTDDVGWLLAGPPGTGHQLDVELDLSEWTGNVALVHHVINEQAYDYLDVTNNEFVLGRRSGGETRVFDRKRVEVDGRTRLRVAGQTTHFLGYLDGSMVTHGHGPAASAGRVGLRLEGQGTIRLHQIVSTSL